MKRKIALLVGFVATGALAIWVVCPSPKTRVLSLAAPWLEATDSKQLAIKRKNILYLGTGVLQYTVNFSVKDMSAGSTIRIIDGANEVRRELTGEMPDANMHFTGTGNVFTFEHSYLREPGTMINITSIDVTESAIGGIPLMTENAPAVSFPSMPMSLNIPVDLPLPSGEPRYYYLTANGTRGKELEVFCDGNAKVYLTNEAEGFITNFAGRTPEIPGPGGLVVVPRDDLHDKILISVSTDGMPGPAKYAQNCLRLSVNEHVKKLELSVRFKGSAQAFSSDDETLRREFREVIEMASRCMYGATLGHARIDKVKLIVGDHVRRDVVTQIQIDPNYASPMSEANVGPFPPGQMALYREWWNYSGTTCATIFVHECGHMLWGLPDEYGEGFPVKDCMIRRVNFEVCVDSMMNYDDQQEFCTDETHQTAPNNPNAKSAWRILAPQLGIPQPSNSPTRLSQRFSQTRIPVEIIELRNR